MYYVNYTEANEDQLRINIYLLDDCRTTGSSVKYDSLVDYYYVNQTKKEQVEKIVYFLKKLEFLKPEDFNGDGIVRLSPKIFVKVMQNEKDKDIEEWLALQLLGI